MSLPFSLTLHWLHWLLSDTLHFPRAGPSVKWTGGISTSWKPTGQVRIHGVSRALGRAKKQRNKAMWLLLKTITRSIQYCCWLCHQVLNMFSGRTENKTLHLHYSVSKNRTQTSSTLAVEINVHVKEICNRGNKFFPTPIIFSYLATIKAKYWKSGMRASRMGIINYLLSRNGVTQTCHSILRIPSKEERETSKSKQGNKGSSVILF